MNKTEILRRVICTLACFVLCTCIFLLTICAVLGLAFSEKYLKYIVDKSNYVELSYNALHTQLADVTIPSGLPIDFFNDKIDKVVFQNRIIDAFVSHVENKAPSFTVEDIEKEFYDMSYEYALTQNRVISDEAEESLQGFAEECAKRYVLFSNPSSVKLILTKAYIIRKILFIGLIVVGLLGIGCLVFLYFLCRKRDLQKHISFALLGTALLSGVLPALLLFSKEVRNVAITAEALYSLTVHFLEGILTLAIIFAIVYFIAVLLALIIRAIVFKTRKADTQNQL